MELFCKVCTASTPYACAYLERATVIYLYSFINIYLFVVHCLKNVFTLRKIGTFERKIGTKKSKIGNLCEHKRIEK